MTNRRIRLWSSASLLVLFIPFGFLARANNGFADGGGIPCVWRYLIGFPCPGCGLTRAFASLSDLDLIASLRFNPEALLFTLFALAALVAPQQISRLSARLNRKMEKTGGKGKFLITLTLVLGLWIVNIVRVKTGFYPASY